MKPHKNAYTMEEKATIINALKEGANIEQLKTISNRSESSILHMLKIHGYTLSNKPYSLDNLK